MVGLSYLSVRHACQPSRDAPSRRPIYRPGQIVLQTGRRIHAYSLRTINVTKRRANSCLENLILSQKFALGQNMKSRDQAIHIL